ncbi:uncharacterized protein NEMAJ01_1795 [Nematocida major]|uniref:uncharacterized protein n=1 Tax=Nematocida major TaxID=1912982 RepID=UPI002008329A|nr:uncharacterized protein NEMAJ01_1795 [Nematocida major]KAH9386899.1 hypothetical protein NEMAJ01_1795 [Nematocida major]
MENGFNPYYPILLHALNKEEAPIHQNIEIYKECLINETEINHKAISERDEFPYCLCSLPLPILKKATEIEYITLTPKSMHIGLITSCESPKKKRPTENCADTASRVLRRKRVTLKCSCKTIKKMDWHSCECIKLVGLLTDYKFKLLSQHRLLESIFSQAPESKELDAEKIASEMLLSDADIMACVSKYIPDNKVKELLMSQTATPEQSELFSRILRETRKKRS